MIKEHTVKNCPYCNGELYILSGFASKETIYCRECEREWREHHYVDADSAFG
jgi:uncharacterized protein (DUF983 family)